MITPSTLLKYPDFVNCVKSAVPRFSAQWLNFEQEQAVSAGTFPPVFIVAGPGTGKTTVLALRALKHVFVDGFPPETIIATTFTRKAARELRSRILGWGVAIHDEALRQAAIKNDIALLAWLNAIDINAVRTGTLDALADEMIQDDRQPTEITPVVIEQFMATGLLRQEVLLPARWDNDADLALHLRTLRPRFPYATAFADKLNAIRDFADRVLHDAIDLQSYGATGVGYKKLKQVVDDYHNYLQHVTLMDFALLEQDLLNRLRSARLLTTTQSLNALLVDEFQDTNYLQEQIYYELCGRSHAALTVVGDDDQSIFRFRGATVEIFADFENRITSSLGSGWRPRRIDLVENYRSTQRIVQFCNHFIAAEPTFQSVRAPGKKACIAKGQYAQPGFPQAPILGMFRHDQQTLAADLCGFLGDVFRGNGYIVPTANNQPYVIGCSTGGDFGDAVLLAGQVSEWRDTQGQPEPRLPLRIRQSLKTLYGVEVFNPRGRNLGEIDEVASLLGLMLECIDPGSRVQSTINTIRSNAQGRLNGWRDRARQFMSLNPLPHNLNQFVIDWGNRWFHNTQVKEWPLLELMFTLVSWFPSLQKHPEGQVYLEAIARTIAESGQIARYDSQILCKGTAQDDASVKAAIRGIFEPIAENSVAVDEEIMPYVPRSHFPIMTIHQAKGLEFPLVIVDVGSAFEQEHHTQRKHRYPHEGDNVHATEDHCAAYTPVGSPRIARPAVLRAFDDLRRLYYVAKSRPHVVLLLVGLTTLMSAPGGASAVYAVQTGDLYVDVAQRRRTRTNPNPIPRIYDFIPSTSWSPNSSFNTVALI